MFKIFCHREYIMLLAILILACFLRFWQLGKIPTGVTHDEVGYIYNSYSIAITGRNVLSEFVPFLTWLNPGGTPFMPVPMYLSVPFFWLFGLSATVGRLPSALLGILDVLLVYILVKQIFYKPSLALVSALFLAISPWHLHFSRTAYDPNFSLFFYLLGIVIFIYEIRKKRLPIASLISFFLAIFSYRGMNIIFPPIGLVLLWYGMTALNIDRRQLVAFLLGTIFILSSLFAVTVLNGKKYISEGLGVNNSHIQEEIDNQIREAQVPLFIRRFFLNKPTYIASKLRENYIKAYSPEFLFLYTEPSKIYSIWSRGRIYFLDLFCIMLGIGYLYKINKSGAFFITSMVLIGGLPGMVGGLPYSARNFFLSAFFPIFAAGGVSFLLFNLFPKKMRLLVIAMLMVGYGYLLSSYLFDYYGRYAYYAAESWFKSLKDISRMIVENSQKYNKIIIGTSSSGDFLQYAFYAKIHPNEAQRAWQKRNTGSNESFVVKNVTFTVACFDNEREGVPILYGSTPLLYIVHEGCVNAASPSAFIRDYYGNVVWKVYDIR